MPFATETTNVENKITKASAGCAAIVNIHPYSSFPFSTDRPTKRPKERRRRTKHTQSTHLYR